MFERVIRILELDKIIDIVSGFAVSELGKKLVLSMEVFSELEKT